MLAAALTFTAMTSLIKLLGNDYSPGLQAFYRQAAGLAVLLPVLLRRRRTLLRTTRPGIMLYRALATTVAMILGFYAYQELPLADANALSFTRTLWLVPLAMFVLRESMGVWRIGATLVGFCGALVMLQPSGHAPFGWPAAAALASALIFATTVTGVKVMTRDHDAMQLISWAAVLGFTLTTPIGILEWRWPAPIDLTLLSAMGVLGLASQFFYVKGMERGDAVAMAPLDYTRLVFAALTGMLFFQETPNGATLAGAAIIIGSTLVITVREARFKKPPPPVQES